MKCGDNELKVLIYPQGKVRGEGGGMRQIERETSDCMISLFQGSL